MCIGILFPLMAHSYEKDAADKLGRYQKASSTGIKMEPALITCNKILMLREKLLQIVYVATARGYLHGKPM